MPQNPNTSKISTFIGIILLIAVIGFTVFVNQKSPTITKEKEIVEVINQDSTKKKIQVKSYFNAFNKEDVENFWKLENFKTDSMHVKKDKDKTSIQIKKIILTTKTKSYNHVKDEESYNKLNDSLEIIFRKKYDVNYKKRGFWTSHPNIPSITTHIVHYGKLEFSYQNQDDNYYGSKVFENFEINDSNKKLFNLTEIGDIFIKYQIRKVYTDPEEIGDLTVIVLADGKKIFLIKENASVRGGGYFAELLTGASYINDSTRIVLPSR